MSVTPVALDHQFGFCLSFCTHIYTGCIVDHLSSQSSGSQALKLHIHITQLDVTVFVCTQKLSIYIYIHVTCPIYSNSNMHASFICLQVHSYKSNCQKSLPVVIVKNTSFIDGLGQVGLQGYAQSSSLILAPLVCPLYQ